MEQNLSKAFTEVYEILKVTPIELTSKIPTKFRKIIEENRDKEYRFQLEEPFNEKDLKEETIIILGLIYRDFLASPEEKEKLQKQDLDEIQKIEQEVQEQYENQLIIYKERGIFNKILNVFSLFE